MFLKIEGIKKRKKEKKKKGRKKKRGGGRITPKNCKSLM